MYSKAVKLFCSDRIEEMGGGVEGERFDMGWWGSLEYGRGALNIGKSTDISHIKR